MHYFRLWLRGNRDDRTLAFVRDPPKDLGVWNYCLLEGERVGDRFPRDAKVHLDPESPGIKLESVLGNLLNYLMVTTQMKDVILSVCTSEIETLPFILYNHKNRVHSKDYWIINPIGTFDCVNRAASRIVMDSTGQDIIRVDSLAFDREKMASAPDLFRVPEKPEWMFISEALARAIKQHKLTNVILKEEISLVVST
jgi:hypothetical protein